MFRERIHRKMSRSEKKQSIFTTSSKRLTLWAERQTQRNSLPSFSYLKKKSFFYAVTTELEITLGRQITCCEESYAQVAHKNKNLSQSSTKLLIRKCLPSCDVGQTIFVTFPPQKVIAKEDAKRNEPQKSFMIRKKIQFCYFNVDHLQNRMNKKRKARPFQSPSSPSMWKLIRPPVAANKTKWHLDKKQQGWELWLQLPFEGLLLGWAAFN